MKFIIFCTNLHFFIFLPPSRLQSLACFQILILHSSIINNLPAIFHNIFPKASVLLIQVLYHKKALPNRQCTSFHATGCHFTGPIALRHSLSTALPRIFSFACLSSFGKKFENEKRCCSAIHSAKQHLEILSRSPKERFL